MEKGGISANIKALRKKNKMSQAELAEKIHITPQAISKWETRKSLPDMYTLKLLAEIFNVSLDELISENLESGKSLENNTQQVNTKNTNEIVEAEENLSEINEREKKNRNWFGFLSVTLNFLWTLILGKFFLYKHSFMQYIILMLCYLGLIFVFLVIDRAYLDQKKVYGSIFLILNAVVFVLMAVFFYLLSLN